ncbi:MAG: hypothetical protein HY453_00325 [Parcubacteria group bacterium]|nr:hypothetical protein [Parcubacteria group bacterium]
MFSKRFMAALGMMLFSSFFVVTGSFAQALEYDLAIYSNDIFFSESKIVAGQKIRLYARIHNLGKKDTAAMVVFYQGDNIVIGASQVVTVRANGFADEVYVDWVAPSGSFNIRVEIRNADPRDEDASNNVAISSVFVPLPDTDKDGIPDGEDDDNDNDGIPDAQEKNFGSNPNNPDTDGDGVMDGKDNCLLLKNPDQKDSDGDGKGDACDPNAESELPAEPTPVSQPAEEKPLPKTPPETQKPVQETAPKLSEAQIVEENSVTPSESSQDSNSISETFTSETLQLFSVDAMKVSKKSWKEYRFVSLAEDILDIPELTHEWDFGDKTGVFYGQEIDHRFPKYGEYTVTLSGFDKEGNKIEAKYPISISFFDGDNWILWLIILFFFGLFLLSLYLLFLAKEKRTIPYDFFKKKGREDDMQKTESSEDTDQEVKEKIPQKEENDEEKAKTEANIKKSPSKKGKKKSELDDDSLEEDLKYLQ